MGVRRLPSVLGAPSPSAADAFDLRELWYALLKKPWASLAVVPAHAGGKADQLAQRLAEAGGLYSRRPLKFLRGDALDLGKAAQLAMQLSDPRPREPGPNTIVSLESLIANPLGIGVVVAADATLLVLERMRCDFDSARKTIEMIGREKILGCALLDEAP